MPAMPSLFGPPARRRSRRIGGGVALAAIAPAAALIAGSLPTGDSGFTATLHAPHVGATNPGFGTGSCPAPADGAQGDWGWHFVLPANKTTFEQIRVTVKAPTGEQFEITQFQSHPTEKHAYVFTPGGGYTLVGAVADVNGPATRFVLSHVCTGTTDNPPPHISG